MPESTDPPTEKSPQVPLVKGQAVSLGCGTLILIALIVLIFGGRGVTDLRRDVQALRSEIVELKKSVDAQAAEIRTLQQKVDEVRGGEGLR
jgi:uncharacterized protein YlxW (UPF0749 family)